MKISNIKNSERTGLIVGIVLILFSIVLGIVPFVFSWDMMQWGYGTICIGLFIFISGWITFFMYIFRYLRLRSILNGKNVIVHWTYTGVKIKEQAKKELRKSINENRFKLYAVWFFFILFTALFIVIGFSSGEEDSMGWFLLIMISIALFITLIGLIMPYVIYRSSLNSQPEAIIATNGMYYMGRLHTWNKPLFLIDELKIDNKKNELIFTMKYFTKLGWYKYEAYNVNIPIPDGQMKEAKEVVEILAKN